MAAQRWNWGTATMVGMPPAGVHRSLHWLTERQTQMGCTIPWPCIPHMHLRPFLSHTSGLVSTPFGCSGAAESAFGNAPQWLPSLSPVSGHRITRTPIPMGRQQGSPGYAQYSSVATVPDPIPVQYMTAPGGGAWVHSSRGWWVGVKGPPPAHTCRTPWPLRLEYRGVPHTWGVYPPHGGCTPHMGGVPHTCRTPWPLRLEYRGVLGKPNRVLTRHVHTPRLLTREPDTHTHKPPPERLSRRPSLEKCTWAAAHGTHHSHALYLGFVTQIQSPKTTEGTSGVGVLHLSSHFPCVEERDPRGGIPIGGIPIGPCTTHPFTLGLV